MKTYKYQPGFETYEQFLAWADRANLCVKIDEKVDLQDQYGHTKVEDLKAFQKKAAEDPNDRRKVAFAIWKIMGDDPFWEFVKVAACQQVKKNMEELYAKLEADEKKFDEMLSARVKKLEKREAALDQRIAIFRECQKPIHKRIATLNRRYLQLEAHNSFLQTENMNLRNENMEMRKAAGIAQAKADQWNQLATLLKGAIDG